MRQSKQKAVIFEGGLDLITPPLKVRPGRLLEMQNYECDLNGGYSQVEGFERFDGLQAPSTSSFTAIATGIPSGFFTVGGGVTQDVSGATAVVLYLGVGGLYLVDVVGDFNDTDIINDDTTARTVTPASLPYLDLVISENEVYNDMRYLKEIYYRDLIQAVPGTGDVRGVFRHEDITLAVRDFDGSEARMYKASAASWVEINASYVMFYDTRALPIPLNGTLIDDGLGNTATLLRAGPITTAGNEGYMVLTGYTSGFAAGANIEAGASVIAVVAVGGDPTQFVLAPGGKNEWRSHTFTAAIDFYRVYTADGVNPCVEYDPIANAMAPIYTDQSNIADDLPTFVDIYRNHLFLGFARGMIRNSEPGDPFLWDAAAGSLETYVGSTITGFDSVPKALIVATRRTTYALTGQIAENFLLDVASAKTGAKPYTVQHIGSTHVLDDRGIIDLSRTEAFGNFENATVSRLIQPLLISLRDKISASSISLSKNIYRLFTSDGEGVSVAFQEGSAVGFGVYNLGLDISVMSSSEDELGDERTFFGSSDGFVYEMDRGVSFDGAEKSCWLQTVFHNLGSSTLRKRFYRAFFDILVVGQANVEITASYSNESTDVRATAAAPDELRGFKSAWDSGAWNNAQYDTSSVIGSGYIDLTGTGDSISLIIYSKSAKDDIVTFKDVIYTFKPRRSLRGSR